MGLADMPWDGRAAATVRHQVLAGGAGQPGVLQYRVLRASFAPTEIRATALGFGTTVSRASAALGTFLFPILTGIWGVKVVMLVVAAICTIGFAVSYRYAPETRGLSLATTSRDA